MLCAACIAYIGAVMLFAAPGGGAKQGADSEMVSDQYVN